MALDQDFWNRVNQRMAQEQQQQQDWAAQQQQAVDDTNPLLRGFLSGAAGVVEGQAQLGNLMGIGDGELAGYLKGVGERNARKKEYTIGDMIPFASDYWTNGEGVWYDTANLLGSSAALMGETAAVTTGLGAIGGALGLGGAAATGAAARGAGLGGKILNAAERGASYAPKAVNAVTKGMAKSASKYGMKKFAKALEGPFGQMYALNVLKTPAEVASEMGNAGGDALAEGADIDEARKRALIVGAIQAPLLALSNTLESSNLGKVFAKEAGEEVAKKAGKEGFKKILENITVEGLQNAWEEGMQQSSQEYAAGNQSLTGVVNPFSWSEDARQQAAVGGVGGLVLGGGNAALGRIGGKKKANGNNNSNAANAGAGVNANGNATTGDSGGAGGGVAAGGAVNGGVDSTNEQVESARDYLDNAYANADNEKDKEVIGAAADSDDPTVILNTAKRYGWAGIPANTEEAQEVKAKEAQAQAQTQTQTQALESAKAQAAQQVQEQQAQQGIAQEPVAGNSPEAQRQQAAVEAVNNKIAEMNGANAPEQNQAPAAVGNNNNIGQQPGNGAAQNLPSVNTATASPAAQASEAESAQINTRQKALAKQLARIDGKKNLVTSDGEINTTELRNSLPSKRFLNETPDAVIIGRAALAGDKKAIAQFEKYGFSKQAAILDAIQNGLENYQLTDEDSVQMTKYDAAARKRAVTVLRDRIAKATYTKRMSRAERTRLRRLAQNGSEAQLRAVARSLGISIPPLMDNTSAPEQIGTKQIIAGDTESSNENVSEAPALTEPKAGQSAPAQEPSISVQEPQAPAPASASQPAAEGTAPKASGKKAESQAQSEPAQQQANTASDGLPEKIKIGHSIMSPVVSDDGKTISFKPPQGTTYTNAESADLKNAGFVYSAGVGMRAPNTQAAQNFLRSYAVDKTAAPVSKAAAKKASKPKSESGENKKATAKKATTKKKEANDNGKKGKESNNVGLDKRRVSEPEKAAADNAQQEARNAGQDQKAEEVESEKNKKTVSTEENIANGKKASQKVADTHGTVENAQPKKTRRQAQQALKTALDKIMEGARQAKLPQKIVSAWRSLLRARAIAYDPYDPARMFEEHPLVVRNNTKDFVDYAQSAWHGSPYKFDKFDLGKIGAGEGNQIYGWGLYFAQNRKISEEYYRDRLAAQKKPEDIEEASALKITYKDGATETVTRKDQFDFLADWTKADGTKSPLSGNFVFLADYNMDIQDTLDYFSRQLRDCMRERADMISSEKSFAAAEFKKVEAAIKEYQKMITFLKSVSSITAADDNITPSLYEVEIPDNDVLLDNEKALKDQPPKVREALRKLNLKHPPERYYVIEHDGQKYFIRTNSRKSSVQAMADLWRTSNGDYLNPAPSKDKSIVDALIEKFQERKRQGTLQEETVEMPMAEFEKYYLSGAQLYELATKKYGSAKAASQALNSAGIKGITYVGGRDGRCYVVFDDKAVEIIETYNQKMNDALKGAFSARGNESVITFFEGKDATTVIHETGHYFMDMLEKIVKSGRATAQQIEDWNTMLKYGGMTQEEWDAADVKGRTGAHERWAEALETYLMEGKAPTEELKGVFARFKEWLLNVYKSAMGSLRNGNAIELTDDVRRVFDRMLTPAERGEMQTTRKMLEAVTTQENESSTAPQVAETSTKAEPTETKPATEKAKPFVVPEDVDDEYIQEIRSFEDEDNANEAKFKLSEESDIEPGKSRFETVREAFAKDFQNGNDEEFQKFGLTHGTEKSYYEWLADYYSDNNAQNIEQPARESNASTSEANKKGSAEAEPQSSIPKNDSATSEEAVRDKLSEEQEGKKKPAKKESASKQSPAPKAAVKKPEPDENGVVPIYANNHNRYFEGEELEKVREANTKAIMKAAQTIADKYDKGELPANEAKAQITALYKHYYSKAKVKPYTDDLQEQINELRKKITAKKQEAAQPGKKEKQQKAEEIKAEEEATKDIVAEAAQTIEGEPSEVEALDDKTREALNEALNEDELADLEGAATDSELDKDADAGRRELETVILVDFSVDGKLSDGFNERLEKLEKYFADEDMPFESIKAAMQKYGRLLIRTLAAAEDTFVKAGGTTTRRYKAAIANNEEARRSHEAILNDMQDALPNGSFEQQDNGSYEISMPNGAKIGLNIKDRIIVNASEEARAKASHGINQEEDIVIEGSWEKLTGKMLSGFLNLSREGRKGTVFHEVFHAVWDLALTKREQAALLKYFTKIAKEQGRDVYEVMADAYADWELARRRERSSTFGKLWQKIKDVARRLRNAFTGMDDLHDIMQRIESGKVWERSNGLNYESEPLRSIRYSANKTMTKEDADYFKAIRNGDIEEAQRLVNEKAAREGFADAIPEQTKAYVLRTGAAPKKTVKVYKVFTVAPDGSPTALFVAGTEKLPQGVWLDAVDTWHFTGKNGHEYIPSTQNPYTKGGKTGGMQEIPNEEVRQELIRRGYLAEGSKAKSITALAYRPGWHAGTLPFFPQGGKRAQGSNYGNIHRYNQVVFECELAADKDYTAEAQAQPKAKSKSGEVDFRKADLQYMPKDGFYYYATNPMTQADPSLGAWAISGSLKIGRALTEEECNNILAENDKAPQEWEGGALDLTKLGYTGQQNDAARKTLAPITYDDEGNIIPLSQRFNSSKNDVRYSVVKTDKSNTSNQGSNADPDVAVLRKKYKDKLDKAYARNASSSEITEIMNKYQEELVKLYEGKNLERKEKSRIRAAELRELRRAFKAGEINRYKVGGVTIYRDETGKESVEDVNDDFTSRTYVNRRREGKTFANATQKIDDTIHPAERKGLVQKGKDFVKNLYKDFYRNWIDKYDDLGIFDKAVAEAGIEVEGWNTVRNQTQYISNNVSGKVDALINGKEENLKVLSEQYGIKFEKSFAMIMDDLYKAATDMGKYLEGNFPNAADKAEAAYRALSAYLVANRQLEGEKNHKLAYNEEVAKWELDGSKGAKPEYQEYKFEGGMTRAECQEVINAAPNAVKKTAIEYYKLNHKLLDIMVKTQTMSPELAAHLKDKWTKYCPMMRDFGDTEAVDAFVEGIRPGGKGIANVSIPIKNARSEGSARDVLNPLEMTVQSIVNIITRGERNKTGLLLVERAEESGLENFVKRVQGNSGDAKNCIFTVMRDGKKVAYQTTPELFPAVTMGFEPSIKLQWAILTTPAKLLRAGATSSPSFIIRNLLRDTVFAAISSKNGFIPLVDSVKGAYALAHNAQRRAEFENSGVINSAFYGDAESIANALDEMAGGKFNPYNPIDIIKAAFRMFEKGSNFIEAATRMGEFIKAREKNKSIEQAAHEAIELTLNFNRSGIEGQQVNKIVPFFNACIQGGDKMYRLFRDDPAGTALKVGTYIVLPSLVLWAYNHDKDWWKEVDPRIRATNWILPGGIRIPKPQEVGYLFGTGVESILSAAYEQDPKAMGAWADAVKDALVPSFWPTAFLPLLEWNANYSFFLNKQVVNQAQQKLPDAMQYGNYTSEMSKYIGKQTDLSPLKIDNLIRSIFGTMGMAVWQTPDLFAAEKQNLPQKKLSEMAVVRDFIINDMNKNRTMTEFYELKAAAEKQHRAYGKTGSPKKEVQSVNAAARLISKNRMEIRDITNNSKLNPMRKRELIDKKEQEAKRIAQVCIKKYGKYFEY